MDLKPLDPRITAKLLEGHTDTLTAEAEERERFYQAQSCPHCSGNAFTKTGDSRFMFRAGEALPRYLLKCDNCDGIFDPFSGIVLTMGNLAKAWEPEVPLIDGPED